MQPPTVAIMTSDEFIEIIKENIKVLKKEDMEIIPFFLEIFLGKTANENWWKIPKHMQSSVFNYIFFGQDPGSYLKSFILNNLFETFQSADDINIKTIFQQVDWWYNHAPFVCYKTLDRHFRWTSRFGIIGSYLLQNAETTERAEIKELQEEVSKIYAWVHKINTDNSDKPQE